MVHSHLSYCINVYGCANLTSLNPLKLKQKAAIRIVSYAGHRDHTNPLFKQLGILLLNELIKYSNLKCMHNFSHKNLLLSFHEMWITNRERNPNLALRNADNLYVHTCPQLCHFKKTCIVLKSWINHLKYSVVVYGFTFR
jgi:hypothetical protein